MDENLKITRGKTQEELRSDELHSVFEKSEEELAEASRYGTEKYYTASPYSSVVGAMTRIPEKARVNKASAKEPDIGNKERKRIRKENEKKALRYKKLGVVMRLVTPSEAKDFAKIKDPETIKYLREENVSGTKKTRREIMDDAVNHGDYSSFEKLDLTSRNIIASDALYKFIRRFGITEKSNPKEICGLLCKDGDPLKMTNCLDPAVRLGLSLAQRSDGISDELKRVFREIDEELTTIAMVETLTASGNVEAVKEDFQKRHNLSEEAAKVRAEQAMEANRAQQIQLAKKLLLMQLSNFKQVDSKTVKTGPLKKKKVSKETDWKHSMAVALSHCSRVVFTMPKLEKVGRNDAKAHEEMWKLITRNRNGENKAQDNPRASSTHSIVRRKVNGASGFGSTEKKRLFNLIGQRGMNIAIGGIGNAGIGGKTLNNDGSCGHCYSMHKVADYDNYGTMLFGIESDEAGVMNQQGHIHDIHATPEKMSSFGGQRTDEIGDKYGGRQCDLKDYDAAEIALWLNQLEVYMSSPATSPKEKEERKRFMTILAGTKMAGEDKAWFEKKLGMGNF